MKKAQGKREDMKLTVQGSFAAAIRLGISFAWLSMSVSASAQGMTTTTVQGTVYVANGRTGSGTLQVSWPAFTTAGNQAVTAGRTNVTIGADGYVSVKLAPNLGSTPAGLYYTAVYHLSDGTTSTEYWVVPAAAQASLAQIRAQVMPAAQAVQAVNKSYVDQSIAELTQSLLTASGGTLSGPLYLNGDPTQTKQAATKHYVDAEFANAVPMSGAALTGPLTSVQLGAAFQVDQFPGADFGARLQACLNRLDAVYGGTCDARNFSGTLGMSSALVIATANATVQLPCATIATANQIQVTAGTRNVTLRGCALRGASDAGGSAGGTIFLYSGSGPLMQVGDPTYTTNTPGFHLDNAVINTTASASASAQGLVAYRTQEINLQGVYFLGNSNQTGMTLDGTGNYSGGTFQDLEFGGFGTAVNAIGHQISNSASTDWLNASTFLRLHINCPTSDGNPVTGTYGINLQQGDGNTFTGGDVEGCGTALHLGPNAQNNTIVGLRNENSISQVVAEAGSAYNNWITGGTMFTGKLTDNGTRNSFLDTFHRSFNGLNGDWYGSQQDATVTNHYRIGTGAGNERGLLNRYQTDYGYRWTTGLSDAAAGEQFYQVLDELNDVYRISVGQYNNGQSSTNNQTVINAAGSGAVVLNGSANAGTGGVIFGSGGSNGATVATINSAGNAQFNGSLQVAGPSTFSSSATVKNQADGEIDSVLWAGATTNQKESFIYKDYSGTSQWYMVKDASNNWALNSAIGGLDSFKAYQSNNSGDTYVNASKSTGHIRLNYETGSGAETDIYGGSSSALVAAFLGSTAIKFPGLAAATAPSCLQIDNSGYISNTGTACGTGASGVDGTVSAGITGQVAYYAGNGRVLAGMNAVTVSSGGTGASTAEEARENLGAQRAMAGVGSDGASGMVVAGNVAAGTTIPTNSPVVDIRAHTYGGVIDGVTDISPAVAAAATQACTTSGVVLLPCTGSGCYLATGQLPKCSGSTTVQYKLQGTITAGSTVIQQNNSPVICDGQGMSGTFSPRAPNCTIIAPPAHGTLGSTVAAGSVTFTPTFAGGSIANLLVGSSIEVVDNTTCSITTITRTSATTNNVSATYTPPCRIPPGALLTISGVTDGTFNGTALVLSNDYPAGIITWGQTGQSPSTSSGGTLAGINDDTLESCDITAVSGSNVTCNFSHAHDASASWGENAFQMAGKTGSAHTIVGLRVRSCYGACIRLPRTAEVLLDGVSTQPQGWPSALAMDVESSYGWRLTNSSIETAGGRCVFGCSQPSYPMGIRITSISDQTVTDPSDLNMIIDGNTFIMGGIKVDTNGNNATSSLNKIGDLRLHDVTIEQPVGFGLLADARFATVNRGFTLDNFILQDSFNGAPQCLLGYTDQFTTPSSPDTVGFAAFNTLNATLLAGCLANKYWAPPISINGIDYTQGKLARYRYSGMMGVANDGKTLKGEISQAGANMGPALIPFATSNVVVNPASWTCSGTGCTLNVVAGPDWLSTSAGELVTGSGTNPFITVFTRTGTTAINDVILAGVWCMPGQNATASDSCSTLTSFGAYWVASNAADVFDNSSAHASPAYYSSNFSQEPWQPLVGMHVVTTAAVGSHNITMQLYGPSTTGKSTLFAQPFFVYVPYSSKPATWTDEQWFRELARLRTALMHSHVSPNMPAGVLDIGSAFKFYWGSDTNLYRSAANTLKTDNNFVVGGTLNAGATSASSYQGTNLAGTGSRCLHADASGNIVATSADCITGSGNVTVSGTPVNGDIPMWNSATNIVGADSGAHLHDDTTSTMALGNNEHFTGNGYWINKSHDDKIEQWFCALSPWIALGLNTPSGNSTSAVMTGVDASHTCSLNVISGTVSGAGEAVEVSGNSSPITALQTGTGSTTQPWQWSADVYLGTLTSAAYWIGITNSMTSVMPSGDAIFFDSTVSATNWQCKWGSTVTDSGVAAAATTWTDLAMTSDGTTARYYIGGTQVCSVAIGGLTNGGTPAFQSIDRSGSSVTLTINDFLFYRKATK